MKRSWTILFLLCIISFTANAQTYISGIVMDSVNGEPMSRVSVKNLTNKSATKTNYRGSFTIDVENDHYLEFSYQGFKSRVIRIRDTKKIDFMRVKLVIGRTELAAVKIVRPLTDYQKDSVERAEIYRDIFKYEKSTSIFSPVSTIQQLFSKKHKNLRKFKAQVLNMEQQKFIDSKYTPELAAKVTKLKGDELAYFMNAYPMELDYARTAGDLEIYSWIARNWEEYQKINPSAGKEKP